MSVCEDAPLYAELVGTLVLAQKWANVGAERRLSPLGKPYSLICHFPAPLPHLKKGPRAFAFTAICNGYDEIRGRVM